MNKELAEMMFGFGDDRKPNKESVELVEEYVNEFVIALTKEASEVTTKQRVKFEDLLFILRNDPKKYARAEELVLKNKQIASDRKLGDKKFGDLSQF